jgi:D-alanyl-D-alanine dipeptidase
MVAEAWRPLVGEYERGGQRLVLLERSETLHVLLDSGPGLPVVLAGADSLVPLETPGAPGFAIARAGDGAVAGLEDLGGRWTRRVLDGRPFRITPRRPVAELRDAALAALPPVEPGDLLPPDLVEVTSLDSTIRLDVRYATVDNFMGERFYESARVFLQRPAAEALVRAHRRLEALGYGLMLFDAYRPWYVTWMFWEATPDSQKVFVADPAAGSRHNRGAAVDLTLYERATGRPVAMPSGYDEFSERAHPAYPGGTTRERWHRDLLRATLEAEGFRVYEYEWWHFDFAGWERYPVLNLRFEELPG